MSRQDPSSVLASALLRNKKKEGRTNSAKPDSQSSKVGDVKKTKDTRVPNVKRNDISYIFVPDDLMCTKSDLFTNSPKWGTQPFELKDRADISTVDLLKISDAPLASKSLERWIKVSGHTVHYGTDITFNGLKTYALAPWNSEVINNTSVYNGSWGYHVILTPVDPIYYKKVFYHVAHMNEIKVRKGSTIVKGTKLGRIANTGASDGVHAHVSLTYSSVPLNNFVGADSAVRSPIIKDRTLTIIPIHLIVRDFSYHSEQYADPCYRQVYGLSLVKAWKNSAISTKNFGSAFTMPENTSLAVGTTVRQYSKGEIFDKLSDPDFWKAITPEIEKIIEMGTMFTPLGRFSTLGRL